MLFEKRFSATAYRVFIINYNPPFNGGKLQNLKIFLLRIRLLLSVTTSNRSLDVDVRFHPNGSSKLVRMSITRPVLLFPDAVMESNALVSSTSTLAVLTHGQRYSCKTEMKAALGVQHKVQLIPEAWTV